MLFGLFLYTDDKRFCLTEHTDYFVTSFDIHGYNRSIISDDHRIRGCLKDIYIQIQSCAIIRNPCPSVCSVCSVNKKKILVSYKRNVH